MPATLNAANEEAVKAFLAGRILLTDIARVIERVMAEHEPRPLHSLETVLEADREAREMAARLMAGKMIGQSHGPAMTVNSTL